MLFGCLNHYCLSQSAHQLYDVEPVIMPVCSDEDGEVKKN